MACPEASEVTLIGGVWEKWFLMLWALTLQDNVKHTMVLWSMRAMRSALLTISNWIGGKDCNAYLQRAGHTLDPESCTRLWGCDGLGRMPNLELLLFPICYSSTPLVSWWWKKNSCFWTWSLWNKPRFSKFDLRTSRFLHEELTTHLDSILATSPRWAYVNPSSWASLP